MAEYPIEAFILVDVTDDATPAQAAESLLAWLREGGLDEAWVTVRMSDDSIVSVSPAGAALGAGTEER